MERMKILKNGEYVSKEDFEKSGTWGLHIVMDLYECEEGPMRDGGAIKEHVRKLCKMLDVKMFGETIAVDFGADPKVSGFSMLQLIETSNLTAHYANKSNSIYMDIFSCKWYDTKKAVEFTKKFFGAKEVEFHVILRGIGVDKKNY